MNYNIIDLPERRLLSSEETIYYLKLAQAGDKAALDKLVEHNLRLVMKVVYRFKNSGYELQDLFQIGVIGLIKAVNNFDLERKVRFSTYAVTRIIGEIRLYLRDDGLLKVSRSLKRIAREVKKKEEELKKERKYAPSISELATATGYSREEIVQALEAQQNPTSIYQSLNETEGKDLQLLDSLAETKEEDFRKLELVDLLKNLDERSRKIIYWRYFEDKTQGEIAAKLGISQVQVSRLEKKILHKLRAEL